MRGSRNSLSPPSALAVKICGHLLAVGGSEPGRQWIRYDGYAACQSLCNIRRGCDEARLSPWGTARGAATFGLVSLQTDEVVEMELRRLIPAEAGFYVTRIPVAAEITPDSLAAMEAALPASVGLLPSARRFDVIGYACTSGATVIGPGRVAALTQGAADAAAVADPLSATIAALEALELRRIGFVTPYLPEVSAAMRSALEAAGIETVAFGSFEQSDDATVARISRTRSARRRSRSAKIPPVKASSSRAPISRRSASSLRWRRRSVSRCSPAILRSVGACCNWREPRRRIARSHGCCPSFNAGRGHRLAQTTASRQRRWRAI